MFNPVWARRSASGQLDGLAAGFQKKVGRQGLVPWRQSTNSDLMWNPDSESLAARFAHWYNVRRAVPPRGGAEGSDRAASRSA
ncbi:hypothetical protein [Streptomyces sp. 3214.6]|uniref:hypothetical protein n=1 Tax=Streptomyces sp. 3214.6 TaxID=1882757 RepID=UPI00117EA94D|nr:hypothetical protein [Streptomyces sp. 3214.6]